MTCSKPFSIVIEDVSPSSWFKLEEPGSSNRVDSIAGAVLTEFNFGGSLTTSAAAKILNGLVFTFAGAGGSVAMASAASDPLLAYEGNGFDFFGWINPNTGGGANTLDVVYASPTQTIFSLIMGNPGLWRLDARGDVGSELVDYPFVFVPGAWVFWRVYFDNTTGKFGIQIDNGAIMESVASYALVAKVGGRFTLSTNMDAGPDAMFDETGIFQRKLSTAQASDIWNGGAGVTFP